MSRGLRWGLFAVLAFTGGCGPSQTGPAAPKPEPPALLVAAASDLQNALPVLAERFTREQKIEVKLTFGSSGQLAEQIKAGAPFDVFLAANSSFVKDLAAGGDVKADSIRPYALGSLVLAVHRESGGTIETLADLARPDVKRIALANPSFAPYGAAGRQALERAGLWNDVQPKIVQAETVRQALQFVQSGNAEAGLVGRAIARVPEVRLVAVDPKLYDPIVQALGVVARSKRPEAAEAFARFVLGAEGRKVLDEFGFKAPESSP